MTSLSRAAPVTVPIAHLPPSVAGAPARQVLVSPSLIRFGLPARLLLAAGAVAGIWTLALAAMGAA